MEIPYFWLSSLMRAFIFFLLSTTLFSWPMTIFSAAVSTSISLKCWCIMPIPALMASFGERNTTFFPPISISPLSGV